MERETMTFRPGEAAGCSNTLARVQFRFDPRTDVGVLLVEFQPYKSGRTGSAAERADRAGPFTTVYEYAMTRVQFRAFQAAERPGTWLRREFLKPKPPFNKRVNVVWCQGCGTWASDIEGAHRFLVTDGVVPEGHGPVSP